ADRLRRYLSQTGGGVLDEPATAQALASFLTRGLHCGALDDAEVATATGVPREALDALARRRPLPEEPS
ncbi:MAG TPA: aldolase, partial [Mycobacteriales bacterium]|nr:aldolase [Mycobacteriales bacterium]